MRSMFGLLPDSPLSNVRSEGGPSAGLLLPIPDQAFPETIGVWVKAMEITLNDVDQREKWAEGALKLGLEFSPEAVRQDWVSKIESVFH